MEIAIGLELDDSTAGITSWRAMTAVLLETP